MLKRCRLNLHTAVLYLMLRGVYNAVIAWERLIQMSKGVAVNELTPALCSEYLITIVNPCQQCNHQMKREGKQILP